MGCGFQLSDFGLGKWAPKRPMYICCNDVVGTPGYNLLVATPDIQFFSNPHVNQSIKTINKHPLMSCSCIVHLFTENEKSLTESMLLLCVFKGI
jgi:hypothetical protein